jgi:hypothetical protein
MELDYFDNKLVGVPVADMANVDDDAETLKMVLDYYRDLHEKVTANRMTVPFLMER